MNRNCILACDVGGTRLRAAVVETGGSIVSKDVIPTPRDDPGALASLMRSVLDEKARRPVAAAVAARAGPEVVVIGGGVSRAGGLLLGPVRAMLARCQSDCPASHARIVKADRGDEVGLRGGFGYWMDSSRDAKGVGAGGSWGHRPSQGLRLTGEGVVAKAPAGNATCAASRRALPSRRRGHEPAV